MVARRRRPKGSAPKRTAFTPFGCTSGHAMRATARQRGQEKRKSCGAGAVLAADSQGGAGSVEACTSAAFDVITAFAVPSPGCQMGQSVFSGSGALRVTPSGWSPGLLRIGHWLGSRPFRLAPSTMLPPPPAACNAAYRCNSPDGKGPAICDLCWVICDLRRLPHPSPVLAWVG